MVSRVAFLAVLCLTGCRLEPRATDAPETRPLETGRQPDGDRADRVLTDSLPVAPGDTLRVTPDEAAVAPRQAERAVRGPTGLVVPVAGVAPGDLVDTYTQARGEGRTHDAIDILAPRGTPVVAAVAGPVLRLFTSDRGGLTVYQLGPDRRTVYYYAHLDAYAAGLAQGQRLRAGQALGTVGDSGNAVPGNTHLHFAIWRVSDPADFWDGTPVNPYPLLTGRRPAVPQRRTAPADSQPRPPADPTPRPAVGPDAPPDPPR